MLHFDYLPDEINCHLLSWISSSDLYNLSQISPFDLICDWNFWKHRAKKYFKIPEDFFDLAMNRQISGSYRYLELQTRIKPTMDSLAVIEGDVVSGIYDPQALMFKAIHNGDLGLVYQLAPNLTAVQLKEVISKCVDKSNEDTFWIRRTSIALYFKELFTNSGLKCNITIFHLVYQSLDEENWTEVDYFLTDNSEKEITRVLLSLIYTQKPEALRLVEKYLPKKSRTTLSYCLRASLNIGNVSLFETISQYIPKLESKIRSLSKHTSIASSYVGQYDREQFKYREYFDCPNHPYIIDAYVGGNSELIDKISNLGSRTHQNAEIYSWVTIGYNLGVNSMFVYETIKKLQYRQSYIIPSDVDIWTLILNDKDTKWKKKYVLRDFLNILFGWERTDGDGFSPDPGNVDLLNLILSKFIEIPGTKKVMGKIKVPKGYPLAEKVYSAYLKVAL